MGDPWTALSSAAAIAQFIEIGAKVVKGASEIKREGTLLDHKELGKVVRDLTDLTRSLKLRVVSDNEGTLSAQEQVRSGSVLEIFLLMFYQALQTLSSDCQLAAERLLELLQKISKRSWGSLSHFREAILAIWKKDDLDALKNQLQRYREQLALRLLDVLNAKNNEHQAKIVEVLSINHNINDAVKDLQNLSVKNHQEIFTAVLGLQNGETRTLQRPLSDKPDTGTLHHQDVVQTSILYQQDGVVFDQSGQVLQKPTVTSRRMDLSSFEDMVLGALYFRDIQRREDTIEDAFPSTYEWIFSDQGDFMEWLKTGDGCYWIEGKAGSGKSTLMKFLFPNDKTRAALAEWSGSARILISSFYFWNAGTPLQKSQEGLYRSILYHLLEERNFLIPTLFPEILRLLTLHPESQINFTLAELKRALLRLAEQLSNATKICLFIDGADEFAGDHTEISELLYRTASSSAKNIKIVVSSRPIPACVQIFSSCPSIRLGKLTISDIEHYVSEKLCGHPLMAELEISEPKSTEILAHEVASRASGVFLWVVLVVKSLLEGLHNYDRFSDLMHRLDLLPKDLEALYQHMLDSIDAVYQREASFIFRCFLENNEHSIGRMTLLQLSFIYNDDVDHAFANSAANLTIAQIKLRCKAAAGRLRSRCCGLLETFDGSDESGEVVLLHRSVKEFLTRHTSIELLRKLSGPATASISEILVASRIAALRASVRIEKGNILKQVATTMKIKDNVSVAVWDIHACLSYLSEKDFGATDKATRYLDELYRLVSRTGQSGMITGAESLMEALWAWDITAVDFTMRTYQDFSVRRPPGWLFLVGLWGLDGYLIDQLDTLSVTKGADYKSTLLLHLILHLMLRISNGEKQDTKHHTRIDDMQAVRSITALIKNGADLTKNIVLGKPRRRVADFDILLDANGCSTIVRILGVSADLIRMQYLSKSSSDSLAPTDVAAILSVFDIVINHGKLGEKTGVHDAMRDFIRQIPEKSLLREYRHLPEQLLQQLEEVIAASDRQSLANTIIAQEQRNAGKHWLTSFRIHATQSQRLRDSNPGTEIETNIVVGNTDRSRYRKRTLGLFKTSVKGLATTS